MIDNNLANRLLDTLETSLGIPIECFRYEIQDDWRFLLVSVTFDETVGIPEVRRKMIVAQTIANRNVPSRRGDYTWMINAEQNGIIIESVFGGDLSSPSSGFLKGKN